ncbi:MAG: autotransporter-associated beta strand repeat-containing protein [Pirellulales bacterium]|nr:autotransporter-associated beta strand repeat-containing protein [Pirellulales bacterium]
MRLQLNSCFRRVVAGWTVVSAFVFAMTASVPVAEGSVWTVAGGGNYGDSGNWSGGVPNGSAAIADFSQVDLNGDASVTLNADVTLGQLLFGDTGLGTAGSWELRTDELTLPVITLDNGASKPIIRVNTLTPTTFDDAFIAHSLAGSNGFSKVGAGIATLGTGTNNTITGGINIDEGTLRVRGALNAQAITIANGATLDTSPAIRFAQGINVAAGNTATLVAGAGTTDIGNLNASGAMLNLVAIAGRTLRANDNWALNGAPAVVNASGGGRWAFRINGGSYAGGSLQNSAVNLDDITVWTRTNSGGNTVSLGSLSGTSAAILSGGGEGGGSFVTYSIGALNTDTVFAGTVDTTSAPTPNSSTDLGGLNLTKVGTGKLTLSGTLSYQPTGNGTVNRRGGITTVSAGTLALTGSTAIPGGILHGTVGEVLSTINIQSGATLDVAGYSGTYSTAAMQQVVGAGTIVGHYAHDEGVIRPANTISGTTASGINPSVAVGGTINFANNFTWSGGDYAYDLTLNPAAGNDLINVSGTATLTNGTVTPNFLGGIPTTGTYTLMTAGAFSGSPAGITINWPGRSADPVPFIDGNSLKFNAPGVSSASLTWVGNSGSNWDVETTPNWTGASPNTFFQSDSVAFNDSATTFNVNVAANVQPTAVVVNNSANDYVISGTGGISGSATFTKTGSGMLTMTTANTFSGAASISGGTVDIGAAVGALGTGALTLSNAAIMATTNASATTGLTNSSLALPVGTASTISAAGNTNPFSIPAMSGDGDLTLTTVTVGKIIDLSTLTGYTGDLTIIGATDTDEVDPLVTVNTTIVRLNGANSSLPNSKVSLTNGASLRDRATSVQTLTLGALEGDATSTLYGYQGGSGATARTWRIGALNTNTTFAGVIQNSTGSSSTTAPVTLVKIGTGTLELTGENTYTGDTRIEAGTLSINNPYLADGADVFVHTGAIFDLDFMGADVIDSLYLGNIPQTPGIYGAIGSGAAFESAFFTGTGHLSVTTLGAPIVTPGDFNGDGRVDGSDFLQWQRGASPSATDLTAWRTNYGVGAATPTVGAVPEPSAVLLTLGCGLAALGLLKRRN